MRRRSVSPRSRLTRLERTLQQRRQRRAEAAEQRQPSRGWSAPQRLTHCAYLYSLRGGGERGQAAVAAWLMQAHPQLGLAALSPQLARDESHEVARFIDQLRAVRRDEGPQGAVSFCQAHQDFTDDESRRFLAYAIGGSPEQSVTACSSVASGA